MQNLAGATSLRIYPTPENVDASSLETFKPAQGSEHTDPVEDVLADCRRVG